MIDAIKKEQVWGLPVKINNIPVYPVKMIDSLDFFDSVQCLLIPKNSIQDLEIIKMTYLKFLIELGSQEGGYLLSLFKKMLEIIFLTKDIAIVQDSNNNYSIRINDNYINEKDFEKLRVLIGVQNLIKIDEEIKDAELEKKISEAREFLSKRNGKLADLEQQIIAYHCNSGLTYEEIGNLTIYQFRKGLSRMDLIKNADIIQSARYSGFVEFKDVASLPTWLSYIEENDSDDDVLMSKGDFERMAIDKGIVNK